MPPDQIIEELALGPIAYAAAFALGAVLGSFANVCIHRLPPTEEYPEGRSVATPGSHCPRCKAPIRWYDNLPILSYLLLRGRCRACRVAYSPRYLLVEAATGMLFLAVYHAVVAVSYPDEPVALRLGRFGVYALFVFTMVVIAFIDLDHKLILNKVTYPAIAAFYGLGLTLPERQWHDGLVGAAVGYGVVRLVADGYYLLTRREGLGYGDGKLLAVIGALLGWQAVVFALFCGSLLGSVIGVTYLAVRRRGEPSPDRPLRHAELPFGPFLALGAVVYLFIQPWVRVTLGFLSGG